MDEIHGGGPCKRCGRDPAAGFAQIGDDWYCHDGPTGPKLGSCYEEANWDRTAAQMLEEGYPLAGVTAAEFSRLLRDMLS